MKLKTAKECILLESNTDSSRSSYWENRYLKNDKPWDAGNTPRELQDYLSGMQKTGRVLIPGCGSAYEARTFSEAGFEVHAIDFCSSAVQLAKQTMGEWHKCVTLGDFFSFDFGDLAFDIVYERAFLCALPPSLRLQYAKRITELLRVGGQLVGFFVYSQEKSGPPFGLKPGELNAILGERFTLVTDNKARSSVTLFAEKESWQRWERISI